MTRDEMVKCDFNRAIRLNRWGMKATGLWPFHDRFADLKFFFVYLMGLSYALPAIANVHISKESWRTTYTSLRNSTAIVLILVKFAMVRFNREHYKTFLNSIEEDWGRFDQLSSRCKSYMIAYTQKNRFLVLFSFVSSSTAGLIFLALPISTSTGKLPSEGKYPFDVSASPFYEIIYVLQLLQSCVYVVIMLTVDCLPSLVVFHACGQFSVLADTVRTYDGTKQHIANDKRECKCLRCIIERHVFLIKYVERAEESFRSLIFLQFIGSIWNIAIQGFDIVVSAQDRNKIDFLASLIYIVVQSYSIFIFSYIGDCIIQKSELIGYVAYSLNWHEIPQQLTLPVLLIIIRSRKPCVLTAGKFVVMSLESYKNLIFTAASYVSVLKAI